MQDFFDLQRHIWPIQPLWKTALIERIKKQSMAMPFAARRLCLLETDVADSFFFQKRDLGTGFLYQIVQLNLGWGICIFDSFPFLYDCEEGVGVGVPVGAEVRARVGPVAVVEDTS